MTTAQRTRRRVLILVCMVQVFLCLGSISLAMTPVPSNHPDYADADEHLFLSGELTTIEVTIDPFDLADLLENPWSDEYKSCSVHVVNSVIDEIHTDVGIRVRGNTSRNAIKKSWKLSFNTFIPGRQIHGLEKMNLNGEHNDVSVIRSRLAFGRYRDFGVPASRAHHIHLVFNDGALVDGVYIHIEQIDEEFTDAWFGNKNGALYKCLFQGDRADLRYIPPGTGAVYAALGGGSTYEEQNLDTPDHADLAAFIDFVNNSDDATFVVDLPILFSIDNFLRSMAIDVAIGHWDNYWYGANNYYLYNNLDTGRFEYIPYDLDNTYGVDFPGVDWANRPYTGWGDGGYGSTGGLPPLIQRILAAPAFESQLRRYLLEFVGDQFPLSSVEVWIDSIRTMIGPFAFEGSFDNGYMDWGYTTNNFHDSYTFPDEYRDWGWGWDYGLKPYIEDRVAYLTSNVSSPAPLPPLRINEVQAINIGTASDEFGDFDDWVEIYNSGPVAIDLTGMHLSDDAANPGKWVIPAGVSIPAGGYRILWCDNETTEGALHAPFKLDGDGESVGLYDTSVNGSVLIDFLAFPRLGADISYGRFPDGDANLVYMATPTPGTSNITTGNIPPWIDQTNHTPASPEGMEPVTVSTRVVEIDGAISAVRLHYDVGAGFVDVPMTAGAGARVVEETFFAEIPGLPTGTSVAFYVEATDDLGAFSRDPLAAPAETYSYLVDFIPPPLFVNEFMASNNTTIADEFGEFDDWVELYNGGNEDINLAGLHLSDDFTTPDRFALPPIVLESGEFLLVWCDGDPLQGSLHTGFKLSASGEQIGLFSSAANGYAPIDTLSFGVQLSDVSYGREPDGGVLWRFYEEPTPGATNSDTGSVEEPDIGADPLRILGPNPILRPSNVTLAVTSSHPGVASLRLYDVSGKLRRTLHDGEWPGGAREIVWNGRDDGGRRVHSGIYFIRFDTGATVAERRLIVLW